MASFFLPTQHMERNEQGLQILCELRACFESSEILDESRKIPRIQEKTKIKNRLFGMFSSRSFKKTEKGNFLKNSEKFNVLASPRQCDFTFTEKTKTII